MPSKQRMKSLLVGREVTPLREREREREPPDRQDFHMPKESIQWRLRLAQGPPVLDPDACRRPDSRRQLGHWTRSRQVCPVSLRWGLGCAVKAAAPATLTHPMAWRRVNPRRCETRSECYFCSSASAPAQNSGQSGDTRAHKHDSHSNIESSRRALPPKLQLGKGSSRTLLPRLADP